MNLNKIIEQEMAKSGGTARVVEVPKNRRPTPESLRQLGREMGAQIRANDDMRYRSMLNAEKYRIG